MGGGGFPIDLVLFGMIAAVSGLSQPRREMAPEALLLAGPQSGRRWGVQNRG
jgi:hypothetical protein